jgi:hypothetical protein
MGGLWGLLKATSKENMRGQAVSEHVISQGGVMNKVSMNGNNVTIEQRDGNKYLNGRLLEETELRESNFAEALFWGRSE